MAAVAKTLSYPVLQDARLPKFLLVLINLLKLEKLQHACYGHHMILSINSFKIKSKTANKTLAIDTLLC